MMKKLLVVLMVISLVVLCGCGNTGKNADPTDAPTNSGATEPGSVEATTGDDSSVTKPAIDWETPIDVDDSVTEPQGNEETEPSQSDTTEPSEGNDPTEVQDPTEAEDPSVPSEPAESEATEPAATEGSNHSGPIELPMIPG